MKMKKNEKIRMIVVGFIIIVMIASSLGGCISPLSGDDKTSEPEINYDYTTEWFNDSYQFTNLLRTGQMNQYVTDYEGNNSTLTVYLNFTYRFEDRPFSQAGYLNLTLEHPNATGDNYYSQEWTGNEATVNETVVISEVYDGVQLRIRAEGSDGSLSGDQQDYYDLYSTYCFETLNMTSE